MDVSALAWRDLDEFLQQDAPHPQHQQRQQQPQPKEGDGAEAARAEAERLEEQERSRVEKRCVRYAVLKARLREERPGLEPRDVHALRALKRELQLFGTREWRERHACSGDFCSWQHWPAGQQVRDPFGKLLGGRAFRASGLVWVCTRSGQAHLCGEGRCGRAVETEDRSLTCPVSGLVVGESHVDDTHSMNKPRIFATDGDSGRYQGKGGGPQKDFKKLYRVRRVAAPAPSADDEERARKRARREQQQEAAGEGTAQQPAPSPTTPTATATAAAVPKKRSRRKRVRVVPTELPPSALRDDEQYGAAALRRAMEVPSKHLKEAARRLCQEVIFWEGNEAFLQQKLQEAEQKAYRKVERYASACRQESRMPSRTIVRALYLAEQGPVLERVFGCAWLATCEQTVCQQYFQEALMRSYALVCLTPLAQAEKRNVPFTHVALGLLRGLADGISLDVWYDRETRRALDALDVKQLPEEERARCECRTVRLLPSHRALRGIPRDQDMRETGRLDRHRYFSDMVSQRKVKEYLDSLVGFRLSIEQVEAYSLERYMRPLDLDAGLPLRADPGSSFAAPLVPLGAPGRQRRAEGKKKKAAAASGARPSAS